MDDERLKEFQAPRLCSVAFPPYRFLPGRDPHPTANPAGHSFVPPGASEHAVEWRLAEEWVESVDYLLGCDLYNHAYWWEAHEAWEGLWHLPERGSLQYRFLQGLIQVSACHLKLRLGRADGVERLRASSSEYLRSVVDEVGESPYMGLRVGQFLRSVDAYYNVVFHPSSPTLAHDPALFPYCLPTR